LLVQHTVGRAITSAASGTHGIRTQFYNCISSQYNDTWKTNFNNIIRLISRFTVEILLGHAYLGLGFVQVQWDEDHWHAIGETA